MVTFQTMKNSEITISSSNIFLKKSLLLERELYLVCCLTRELEWEVTSDTFRRLLNETIL